MYIYFYKDMNENSVTIYLFNLLNLAVYYFFNRIQRTCTVCCIRDTLIYHKIEYFPMSLNRLRKLVFQIYRMIHKYQNNRLSP